MNHSQNTQETWYRSIPINTSYKTEHENGSVTVDRVPLDSIINNQGNIKEYGIQTDVTPFITIGFYHVLLQISEDTVLDLTDGFTLTQTKDKRSWKLRKKYLDDFSELVQQGYPSDRPGLFLVLETIYNINP
jgi:hypothetical protein